MECKEVKSAVDNIDSVVSLTADEIEAVDNVMY